MIYAYVLIAINSVGVVTYSPPVATITDCNIMKQAVETVSRRTVDLQCVRVELPKGK